MKSDFHLDKVTASLCRGRCPDPSLKAEAGSKEAGRRRPLRVSLRGGKLSGSCLKTYVRFCDFLVPTTGNYRGFAWRGGWGLRRSCPRHSNLGARPLSHLEGDAVKHSGPPRWSRSWLLCIPSWETPLFPSPCLRLEQRSSSGAHLC